LIRRRIKRWDAFSYRGEIGREGGGIRMIDFNGLKIKNKIHVYTDKGNDNIMWHYKQIAPNADLKLHTTFTYK